MGEGFVIIVGIRIPRTAQRSLIRSARHATGTVVPGFGPRKFKFP